MTIREILQIVQSARADYVATLKDAHGLRGYKTPFKAQDFIIINQLDAAITSLAIHADLSELTTSDTVTPSGAGHSGPVSKAEGL